MSAHAVPNSLFDSTPWNPVATICRRMCLLRVLGKPEAAERVHEAELSPALASLGWSESDAAFQSLFHKEEERAAEAAALAELLAPLLTAGHLAREAPAVAAAGEVVAFEPTPEATRPAAQGPASIADMIDGMLEQDRRPQKGRKP